MTRGVKLGIAGCCGTILLAGVAVAAALAWLFSGPESGVKLANEMDPYATEYLARHRLLESAEEVLAYYDATMAMDGTEAAIVTNTRVIYHKNGHTTAIRLAEVEDIRHRKEGLAGDVIEVQARSGQTMKIEIAVLNSGETFLNVLKTARRTAVRPAEGQVPPEAPLQGPAAAGP